MSASEIFASWFRSGPLMTYMISAFFWPLEKAFTYETSVRSFQSA
jgi:hypothetical protein